MDWCSEYIIRSDSFDQGRFTLEGSRPAAAVYLHMNFHCLGRHGLKTYLAHGLNLTKKIAEVLREREDFEIVAEPETNILLYRFVGHRHLAPAQLDDIQAVIQEAQSLRGKGFVSRTRVHMAAVGSKITCLRLVLGNSAVTIEDITKLLDEQRSLGASAVGSLPQNSELTPSELLHQVVLKHDAASVAVRCGRASSMTFGELRTFSSRVAAMIRNSGTEPGSVVAVLVERSCELVATILGVLMAGCVYLGIDETLPRQRIAYLIEEGKARVLLLQESLRLKLPSTLTSNSTLDIQSINDLPAVEGEEAKITADTGITNSLTYALAPQAAASYSHIFIARCFTSVKCLHVRAMARQACGI